MEDFKVRRPTVAGQFYPQDTLQLKRQIEEFIKKDIVKKEVIACVLPHAGYIYSGRVAAETIAHIKIKEKIILLGPNHTGLGASLGIMTEGKWQMPLGDILIDEELAKIFLKKCSDLEEDFLSHLYEHSIEVILPFLQYFKKDFKIVPITVMSNEKEVYKRLGIALAEVIKENNLKDKTLMIASSDMTHYESQVSAEKKDRLAIEAILELDEDKLLERVNRYNISMCGVAPVSIMLSYAKNLEAEKAELIKYQTSGDVSGDYSSVVGYAGIIVY
jgi:AmmeMemoRadiSam system protein B